MTSAKRQKNEIPIVMTRDYSVDVASLSRYAMTTVANVVVCGRNNPSGESDAMLIKKFLSNTCDGNVRIDYDHRELGSELVKHEFIDGARVYPRGHLSCAFSLPLRLRELALAESYYDMDDSKCFHRIMIGLNLNEDATNIAKQILITEPGQIYPKKFLEIAEFYSKPPSEVKWWFHSFSNGGSIGKWKTRESNRTSRNTRFHNGICDCTEHTHYRACS